MTLSLPHLPPRLRLPLFCILSPASPHLSPLHPSQRSMASRSCVVVHFCQFARLCKSVRAQLLMFTSLRVHCCFSCVEIIRVVFALLWSLVAVEPAVPAALCCPGQFRCYGTAAWCISLSLSLSSLTCVTVSLTTLLI